MDELVRRKADNEEVHIETIPGEIKVSVRRFVEFLLREGDIDNRHVGGVEAAMQEGSRIHRMIQKKMGPYYTPEVSLSVSFDTPKYRFTVEGRADGIETKENGDVLIDEIKGTYRDIHKLKRPEKVHLAQAKCYAYMYGIKEGVKRLTVRLTYCNMETEDIRYFYEECTLEGLEKWFLALVEEYRKWTDYSFDWQQKRNRSLEELEFPFEYRDGQKDLVSGVYRTIYHKKKLFIEAPTGVGKTISTIFPALKAMSRHMGERIFYLTAKTITRTVAEDTYKLLRERGLLFKSVILTAKEKICFADEVNCNPESCPYAKGHYDRINEALYDMMIHEDSFDRERIEFYAQKHMVCPFEFSLDMSLFADGIICDYNYLFDPHVYLKRFFAEGGRGEHIFLIDEAHNLLDRGREMYSAELVKERFLELKRELKEEIRKASEEKIMAEMVEDGQLTLDMTGMSMEVSAPKKPKKRGKKGKYILINDGYAEKMIYHLERCNRELLELKRECETIRVGVDVDSLLGALQRLYGVFSDYLAEQEEGKHPIREQILDFFFEVSHFLMISEKLDDHYVVYSRHTEEGEFAVKLFCVNPKQNLKECMLRGRSSILFSATLLPIQYYKELLGGEPQDYELYAKSVFSTEKRALFIASDVTSRYAKRGDSEYRRIATYIHEIVDRRQGNYMVFCPSFRFMQQIYQAYEELYHADGVECLLQRENMDETARMDFLLRFRVNDTLENTGAEDDIHTLIGFCVLGGIFGEGIDLKKDSLIGAIIVGTGLPQIGGEREILQNYFNEREEAGFDYAYRYPGMNKVLQAAGRVIRTAEDIGIIALLDDRFLQYSYRRMFPREWESFERVEVETIGEKVERFWDSWGKY